MKKKDLGQEALILSSSKDRDGPLEWSLSKKH